MMKLNNTTTNNSCVRNFLRIFVPSKQSLQILFRTIFGGAILGIFQIACETSSSFVAPFVKVYCRCFAQVSY